MGALAVAFIVFVLTNVYVATGKGVGALAVAFIV
jgi:hypothetical protein